MALDRNCTLPSLLHPSLCNRRPTVAQIITVLGNEHSVCLGCYKRLLRKGSLAKVLELHLR